MRKINILLVILFACAAAFAQEITQGSLYAAGKNGTQLGACPLNNTKVQADISGFMARVKVVQEFENTFSEPIEAVYTFPLSQNSAVDNMTMRIGERLIRARIMKREEARKVYETAKSEGKTASLLDQERPNIFTQAVANIMPGEKVIIEISYVETLKYEDGSYEFVFPMTVGPRYIPGSVKDAAKISPPLAVSRAGHDISIEVNVNAGVPVEEIRSTSHPVDQVNFNPNSSKVRLKSEKTIPNKDFILRYDVTGKRIEDGILTHRDARGGFFTLMLQPPDKIATEDRTPKEIVFVLDTSGSMSGFPIEKAKEAMKLSLDGLYPDDTFNLITFAGDTEILFEQPVPATQANLEKAQAFLDSRQGGGGTEMMKAIKAALDPSDSQSHLRIVCFMTDAYIGNENEIIAEIQKHPKARVFSFGIGSSVNRFLLDKMAEAGNGEVEYVTLADDGSKAAKKFYERVRTPLLTDLSIDWNGMPVADVYPNKLSDLFSAKPVILHGRFTKAASGTIKLKGKIAGQEYVREIAVNLPETEAANDVLATLWARRRIDELSTEALRGANIEALNKQITGIGIEFRLLTQFTSFVAVEERIVNQNGNPVKVVVPIAVPEGVDPKMSGADLQEVVNVGAGALMTVNTTATSVSGSRRVNRSPANRKSSVSGTGSGMGYGTGNGSGSGGAPPPPAKMAMPISAGVVNGKAEALPKPPYPAAAKAVRAVGAVMVQVTIDENGNVISANPVSGHPLLRAAAAQAARGAKFTPTMLSGQPVKVAGIVTYNFTDPEKSGNVTVTTANMAVDSLGVPSNTPPTPEMMLEQKLKERLHSWLYSLVERLKNGESAVGPNEAKFVREGKAEIQLTVTARSPQLMEKLKNAGFEIASEKGSVLVGRIAVDKIAALAEIGEVKLILPRA
ncbi:MAG: TonB family protein [Pyrinomonadaceae bacterium]